MALKSFVKMNLTFKLWISV